MTKLFRSTILYSKKNMGVSNNYVFLLLIMKRNIRCLCLCWGFPIHGK